MLPWQLDWVGWPLSKPEPDLTPVRAGSTARACSWIAVSYALGVYPSHGACPVGARYTRPGAAVSLSVLCSGLIGGCHVGTG